MSFYTKNGIGSKIRQDLYVQKMYHLVYHGVHQPTYLLTYTCSNFAEAIWTLLNYRREDALAVEVLWSRARLLSDRSCSRSYINDRLLDKCVFGEGDLFAVCHQVFSAHRWRSCVTCVGREAHAIVTYARTRTHTQTHTLYAQCKLIHNIVIQTIFYGARRLLTTAYLFSFNFHTSS